MLALLCVLFVCLGTGFLYAQTRVLDIGVYTLHVSKGMTGRTVAAQLRLDGVVRSTFAMRTALVLSGKSHAMQAGDYTLDTADTPSVFALAEVLLESVPTHEAAMITFPEGTRGRDILAILAKVMSPEALGGITAQTFDNHIGYLFPDTYAVDKTTTVTDLINRMLAEYEATIAPLRDQIPQSRLTESEVIIFASIVEREANDEDSMRRVAGILHNRLEQGMRLQVDATLTYLLDKTSAQLTKDDLALKSPYNTYRNEGLPPTPIANPGRKAIEAVLNPIPSKDLFYLTGDNGTFYYAQTHEQHTANKKKYIR
ncbi:hypothetical protein A3C87_02500 [Candidatus Kaiserbacteria bacterium RIFCSPHIGHO2_02_FULL_49_34]|uniref:Endolytic murein transglycosylase n=1 Tax=Candidatus Kaiserbacteria bacterium RIFCSPHIGHO2_02_FULL_49_34 TaxID=1798491 RepID=A0A1F6DIJ6_9BACT|nr:MAG: hypothetical protein A3C87_02500 [Candidatus Kaiserbacteria bacterium RIFCSPHIGHO2_02_FULL_49_34]